MVFLGQFDEVWKEFKKELVEGIKIITGRAGKN